MIYFVTSRVNSYNKAILLQNDIEITYDIPLFELWVEGERGFQLDTETNIPEDGPMQHIERKLYVVQLGLLNGEDQYVFDMISLNDQWIEVITKFLALNIPFICHNARFEYIVIQVALGIKLQNLHDTFLMSKILNTGLDLPKGYHTLQKCIYRFLNIDISKDEQKTFTSDPLTIPQILYAAEDVVHMMGLFKKLKALLFTWNLWYLYNVVERHVLKVYGDMELTTMRFDAKYWDKLAKGFIEESKDLKEELNKLVLSDKILVKKLKNSAKYLNNVSLIQPKDEYTINWASIIFRNKALTLLAPSFPDTIRTKPQLKKFLKESTIPQEDRDILESYMKRDYVKLDTLLKTNHHKFLEDNNFFIPKNKVLIKWSSPIQKLFIFQHYYPNLSDTNAVTLKRITANKLIVKFKKWSEINKRVTSYGEKFHTKYIQDNGTIAPLNPKQILNTGRISFGILLQLPAEAKFRNAFYPPHENDVFVDTDYSSMEVVIAAYAAKEYEFLKAIKNGKDLHSMSASLMFKDKWKSIAEPGCEHLKTGKKCSCLKHKKFRDFSKTITFGLFYGIGPTGLADRLGVSLSEAKELINKFFKAFPNFKKFFDTNEKSAIKDLYIRGLPPTNRIRFFHPPEYESDKGSIGRQAKNFPIQEASASILKLALIHLRQQIIDENLNFKMHLPVHDEILSSCNVNDQEYLKKIQENCMIKAGDTFLTKGLTTVDTNILTKWTK